MDSVLDELPEAPAAGDEVTAAIHRFIAERGLYLPALDDQQLAAAATDLMQRLSVWAGVRSRSAGPPTERLVRTWLQRRLPDIRDASERYQLFVREHRASHPSWNLSHFIAAWFVAERQPALCELVLIFEVILSKTVDEQEQGISEAVKTVVRRIHDLEKAAAALKSEIATRTAPDGPPFWSGVVDGFAAAIRATVGEEAARGAAAHMEGAFPTLPAPFLALDRLRPEWGALLGAIEHLGAGSIEAMQQNFTSGTLGTAHAPEKRGLQRRIRLLKRARFSPSEIADFEGMKPNAIGQHLRRLGRASSDRGSE